MAGNRSQRRAAKHMGFAVRTDVDETETHLSNLTGGSVSRHGRTLIYRRSYKLGNRTSVQVHATLIVQEGNKTATYTTSQISIAGKSRSKTFAKGNARESRVAACSICSRG